MIRDEDIPRVLDCLRKYFYPYETLCSYRCSTDEEFDEMAADFSTCVVGAIQDGLSFFAEHKPTKQVQFT